VTRRDHRLAVVLLVLPAVAYVGIFLAASSGMTVLQSFGFFSFSSKITVGFQDWLDVLDGQTLDSFVYSTRIALLTVLGTLVLAFPLSLYLRHTFVGKSLLSTLLRVPLFMPGLVAAFVILNILAYHGVVNETLVALGLIPEPLRMINDDWGFGVLAIQIWKNLPLQVLILTAVLTSIPNDLEAAARNLGAGPLAVFRRVLLPLSMPGVQTGATLVGLGVFGDFAVNSIAGPLYPPTLSIRMYLLGYTQDEWGQAGAVGVIIMVASLVYARLLSGVLESNARAPR
jgi:putative spermidine/putrescine transport system permease protein